MSDLARKLIQENKSLFKSGGNARTLDLGNCALTQIPVELFDCTWLKELVLSNKYIDSETNTSKKSKNNLGKNILYDIPNDIKALKDLERLYASGSYEDRWGIFDIDFVSELKNLKVLDLSYNKIERINSVAELENLEFLNLNHNEINKIPLLYELTRLTYLNLYYNEIVELDHFDFPNGIRDLNLGFNNLKDIDFLSSQAALNSLHLQHNSIENLQSISHLKRLETLTLANNSVKDTSPLASLKSLLSLSLSNNIEIDCQHLGGLRKLDSLYLSNNKLLNLDAITDRLTSLRYLTLNKCQIVKVPNLSKLTRLRRLELNENGIEDLDFLTQCDELFDLDLSDNRLSDFSVSFDLPKLFHLNLGDNKLDNLSGLYRCPKLEHLSINNNELNSCAELVKNVNLQYLDVSDNYLNNFDWLYELKELRNLKLNRNPVADLGFLVRCEKVSSLSLDGIKGLDLNVLSDLRQLRELSMDSCEIDNFEFLKRLAALESLSLRFNSISDLLFINELTELKRLDLKGNSIVDCTPIGNLRNLEYLNLVDNSIYEVSLRFLLNLDLGIEFGDDERYGFKPLFLKNNPIEFPPIEILSQGREFAIQYLKTSDKRPLNECKVILIGKGGVGKTTLQKAIMNESIDLNESETHGIRKVTWRSHVKAIGQGFVKVNFWDFGGQHIQQALHQFFYSKNTVYILVLDRRREDDPEDFLELVRGYGNNSPVIIVFNNRLDDSTKYDQNPSIDSTLLNKYPNIVKPIFGVNCVASEDEGINNLRNFLKDYIPHLSHVRASYPTNWLTIKADLLDQVAKNYLLYNDYQKICFDHGLSEDKIQKGLAEMLATVGTITFFDRPFGDNYYVLNPDWLTTGAYQIILSSITRQKKGRINIDDLNRILMQGELDFSYSTQDIKILLDLMSAFDLCHKFQNHSEWLIPSSLEGESKTNLLDFRQDISRRYTIRYSIALPSSVIHRFIVRNLKFSYNEDYWRNGIVVKHPNSETLMFVEADVKDKEIRLYIRGSMIVECWEFFRKDFRELSDKFEFEELIVLESGNVVSYQLLVDARHAGKATIFIGGKSGEIDVLQTLGLFESERTQYRGVEEAEKIDQYYKGGIKIMQKRKIFISYAHHDNEFGQVDTFEIELARVLPKGEFSIFKDDQIIMGENWTDRLNVELEGADIGILLLSPAFFNSGYIVETELVAFLKEYQNRKRILCPIYFSPFKISTSGVISQLQFFKPSGTKYGREFAEVGDNLSYNNFIKFHPNGKILPSVERNQYMLDFVEALLKAVRADD